MKSRMDYLRDEWGYFCHDIRYAWAYNDSIIFTLVISLICSLAFILGLILAGSGYYQLQEPKRRY